MSNSNRGLIIGLLVLGLLLPAAAVGLLIFYERARAVDSMRSAKLREEQAVAEAKRAVQAEREARESQRAALGTDPPAAANVPASNGGSGIPPGGGGGLSDSAAGMSGGGMPGMGPGMMPSLPRMGGMGGMGGGFELPMKPLSELPKGAEYLTNQFRVAVQFEGLPTRLARGVLVRKGSGRDDAYLVLPVAAAANVTAKINGRVTERAPSEIALGNHLSLLRIEHSGAQYLSQFLPVENGQVLPTGYASHGVVLPDLNNAQPLPGTGLFVVPQSGLVPQDLIGDLPEVAVGDELHEIVLSDLAPPGAGRLTVESIEGESTVTGLLKLVGAAPIPGTLLFNRDDFPVAVVVRSVDKTDSTPAVVEAITMQRLFDACAAAASEPKPSAASPAAPYYDGGGGADSPVGDELTAAVQAYRQAADDQREAAKQTLRRLLESRFDAQQTRRLQEIAELTERLEQLRKATQDQTDRRAAIIDKQLETHVAQASSL